MRRLNLTKWIFISLVAGMVVGTWIPSLVPILTPFRDLFLHGIKCIIAPLIFSTIVTGIAAAGNFKQLGKMGLKAFVYFEIVTTLALAVGLLVVNVLKPGAGVHITGLTAEAAKAAIASKQTYAGFIEHLLPTNFVDAIARGDILQIVIFSTIFALAVLSIGVRARPIVALCESVTEVMFKITGYIMYLAPLGVGAGMAAGISEHGWKVMFPLLKLVGSLYFALALFIVAVLFPICKIFGVPAIAFAKQVRKAVLVAFSTTTSEAAYPMTLEALEGFGIPRRISSFVLPLGYSFNLDGSVLYLSLAAVFIAQASGHHMPISQQLLMMLTLMLTSKGIAAVPRASLVVLTGTLMTFGLPLDGIALIFGVDALMDMARTGVNLLGNCLATAVIARSEGITLGVRVKQHIPVEHPERTWEQPSYAEEPLPTVTPPQSPTITPPRGPKIFS